MAESEKLTQDAQEQPVEGKSKGKGKKVKTPKEKTPKEKTPKASKTKEGKRFFKKGAKSEKPARKKGGFIKFLLIPAFLAALLLVAGVVFFLDIFSVRSTVLATANQMLASRDPEYRQYVEQLSEREAALDLREADISLREAELQQREDALANDDSSLKRRAAALDEREKKLRGQELAATPMFRREISEEKLTELKNLGRIYSNIEVEAAAQALSLLNSPVEMAEVLFYMDKNAAADLLGALDAEIAAQITREMLRE